MSNMRIYRYIGLPASVTRGIKIGVDARDAIKTLEGFARKLQSVKKGTAETNTVMVESAEGVRTLTTTITGVNEQFEQFTRVVTRTAEAGMEFNRSSKQTIVTTTEVLNATQKLNIEREKGNQVLRDQMAANAKAATKEKDQAKESRQAQEVNIAGRDKQYNEDRQRHISEESAKEENHRRNGQRVKEDLAGADDKRRAMVRHYEAAGDVHMRARTHHRTRTQQHAEALKMNQAFDASLNKQKKSVGILAVAWKSFGRLIALRAIAGLIFRIKSEVINLAKAFADLNKGVAEIQTIITPGEQTTAKAGEISDRIVRVAAQNNIALSDSVNAFYANLSNQVSNNLDGLELFTATAVRLSKATVSSLEDSGNAISSIVQAYNLSFNDAERVSASLFKTVDEGRVRLTEMANVIGTIGVPAHALGITFDETNAAVGRLTLQGIKFNRASTLLRNVFLKLLKPTENLKDLYKQWGVNSGEAAIKAFGFSGVLVRLNKEAEKGANVLPELFSRIRATIGAQGLAGTTENVEEFIRTLDKVSDASDEFNKAVKIVTDSAGEKFQRELNKTKILLTDTFGKTAVMALNDMNDWIKKISGEVSTLANWIATAVGQLVTLVAVSGTVLAIFKAISIIKASPWATGVSIGFAVISGIALRSVQAAGRLRNEIKRIKDEAKDLAIETSRAFAERLIRKFARQLKISTVKVKEMLKDTAELTAALTTQVGLSDRILDNYEKEYQARIDIRKEAIKANTEYKNGIPYLKAQLTIQEDIAKVAKKRAKDLAFGYEGARFDRGQRGKTDTERINAMLNRSNDLARRARGAFASGDYDEGRKFIDEAHSLLTQADQEQFDIFGTTKFEERFTNLEALAIDLEKTAEAKASRAKQALAQELARITTNLEKDKAIIKVMEGILKNVQTTREEIVDITNDQSLSEEMQNNLIVARIKLIDLQMGKGAQYGLVIWNQVAATQKLAEVEKARKDLIAKEDQLTEDITALSATEISMEKLAGDFASRLTGAIDGAITSLKADPRMKVPKGMAFDETGEGAPTLLQKEAHAAAKARLREMEALKTEADRLTRAVEGNNEGTLAFHNAIIDLEAVKVKLDELSLGITTAGSETLADNIAAIQPVIEGYTASMLSPGWSAMSDQMQEFTTEHIKNKEAVKETTEEITKLHDISTGPEASAAQQAFLDNTEAMRESSEASEKAAQDAIVEAQLKNSALVTGMTSDQGIEQLNKFKEAHKQVKVPIEEEGKVIKEVATQNERNNTATGEAAKLTPQHEQDLHTTTVLTRAQRVAVQQLAAAQERANRAKANKDAGMGIETWEAQGGPIFRSVGSDTIPAMLTPGEFVVNARSAQAHIGLLNRINSGRPPQHFAKGGTVNTDNSTNTINLQSTSNENLDARRIQRALNKGKRRGTSSPRPRNFA